MKVSIRIGHFAGTLTGLLVGLLAGPFSGTALADAEPRLSGSTTLKLEHADSFGDSSRSPFSASGLHSSLDFNLTGDYRPSRYRRWQGQLSGVVNDSEFRGSERGVLVERFNLRHERGDADLPFRVEAGDYLAFLSQRTVQRSLKGIRLELQPRIGGRQQRHSIIAFAGSNLPSWRELDAGDDASAGLSWLMVETDRRLIANLFSNRRAADPGTNTPEASQLTGSFAGEQGWSFDGPLGRHKLKLEGELALFDGDHGGGQDRSDQGWFLQLSDKPGNSPWQWRLRGERYGADFQPNGASAPANRRSMEAHLSWRGTDGLSVRGRLQQFRTNLESLNPLDTTTLGVNLSGPFAEGVSGSINAFRQQQRSADQTTRSDTDSISANLSSRLGIWQTSLGYNIQSRRDRVNAANHSDNHQLSLRAAASLRDLGLDDALFGGGWRGQVSPSLSLRLNDSSSSARDINPGFAMNISRQQHSLALNLSQNRNRPDASNNSDTLSLNINYRYRGKRDQFGLVLASNHRDADGAQNTDAYKLSFTWQHSLDAAPETQTTAAGASRTRESLRAGNGLNDLSELQLGMPIRQAVRRVGRVNRAGSANGANGVNRIGAFQVFDMPLFERINQRQRLVLEARAGSLERAALLIDFEDDGSPDNAAQQFAAVLDQMISRYGNPEDFRENGGFDAAGGNLALALDSGLLTRVYEWRRGDARLRFGLPRRLDGQVRLELQMARDFPPIGSDAADALWSLEEVQ